MATRRRRRGRAAARVSGGRRGDGLRAALDPPLDVVSLTVYEKSSAAALPVERLLLLSRARTELCRALRRRVAPLRRPRPRSFPHACEGATLAIIKTSSDPLLTLTDIELVAQRRARRRCPALLQQHVLDAAPPAPARPGADLAWRTRRSTSPPLRRARWGDHDARSGAARATRADAPRRSTACRCRPAWLLLRGLRTLHVRLPARWRAQSTWRAACPSVPRCARCAPAGPAVPITSSHCARCRHAAASRLRARNGADRGLCEAPSARPLRDHPRRRRDADQRRARMEPPRDGSPSGSCGSPSASSTSTTSGPISCRRCGRRRWRTHAVE